MKARVKLMAAMAAMAATIVTAGFLLSLNWAQERGFCSTSGRFNSDRALMDAAIDSLSRQEWVTITTREGDVLMLRSYRVVPSSSVSMFHRENPACCVLRRRGNDDEPAISWVSFIVGKVRAYVNVAYTQRYRDDDGRIMSQRVVQSVPVDNCRNSVEMN